MPSQAEMLAMLTTGIAKIKKKQSAALAKRKSRSKKAQKSKSKRTGNVGLKALGIY
jgi:hypothetical protein